MTRSLINRKCNDQATFMDHVTRRGKMEHLVTTGKYQKKRQLDNTTLGGLTRWLALG